MNEKYISSYDTENDYLAAKASLDLPHVSLIVDTMEIKYDPVVTEVNNEEEEVNE